MVGFAQGEPFQAFQLLLLGCYSFLAIAFVVVAALWQSVGWPSLVIFAGAAAVVLPVIGWSVKQARQRNFEDVGLIAMTDLRVVTIKKSGVNLLANRADVSGIAKDGEYTTLKFTNGRPRLRLKLVTGIQPMIGRTRRIAKDDHDS